MNLMMEHVSKKFKDKKAVQDVNVVLQEGVHGLLGANGSGKTTLMRMICGLLKSDEGSIFLDELNIKSQYDSYCAVLGYMPQHFGFYPHYSVQEFLDYMSIVKNIKKDVAKKRINELLGLLNLEDKRKTKMKALSGGMLKRVGIAIALLNEPKILILDEPTAGLDPKERIIFRNLIASLSQHTIILLSTHIVSDIETIADDILVMKEGKILLHDTCEAMLSSMEGKVWEAAVTKKEALALMQKFITVKSHHYADHSELRLIADMQPCPAAASVKPDLDDLYLYYFEEEALCEG